MKIIDKFLIKAFIPPFIVSFGIASFVLVMQVLWVYIDEIMGKGLSIFDITELIFYLSMTLVPTALPIAVLIASVMVTGNLAEKYELSSFKSAGVGLVRILRPLFVAVLVITIFSIFVSERVIPWANLKFYSRFYDIRKSKPTLAFQEGIFNDEFQDYTMRIGKKGKDGRSLENIMIFNNRNVNQQTNESISKKGEMYTTADKQYIVMNLFDGMQYQETDNTSPNKQTYPFVRIKFKSWQKIFDLTEFDKKKTDEGLFKNHQKMKNSSQLKHFADSILLEEPRYFNELKITVTDNYTPLRDKFKNQTPPSAGKIVSINTTKTDTVVQNIKLNTQVDSFSKAALAGTPFEKNKATLKEIPKEIPKADTQSLKQLPKLFYAYLDSLKPYETMTYLNTAETKARNVQNAADNAINQIQMIEDSAGKFIYEMYMKYNFALICLVFLFIGAPMGAIIQKGGFGMPILVAIGFFMIYMVSNIYCKNLKGSHDLSVFWAAWLPVVIMLPIAAFLTHRALNDYKMLNFDPLKFFQKLKLPKFLRK